MIIGYIIINKLKEQYYEFTQISDFIQYIYFDEPMFTKVCSYYQYVQREILKIRYFVP
jgi:hypothetical protein